MEYLELNGVTYAGDYEHRILCFIRETSTSQNFWLTSNIVIDHKKALELIKENKILVLNTVL